MRRYVVGNEIMIPKDDWARLKEAYSQDQLVDGLNRLITRYAIAFPLKSPTLEDALADFQKLKRVRAPALFCRADSPVASRYEYERSLGDLYLDMSNTGNKFSNYFHFDARMNCDSVNSPSPMRVWAVPKFREGVLRALFSLKAEEVSSKTLGQSLALRKYVASQFRPSAALALYNRWARDGDVLDMCSGWGDRLAGFLASKAATYTGFDPNLRLHEGYRAQIACAERNGDAVIHWLPFEKAELADSSFDFAFTSPPYFNIERYSKDEGQSFNYKTLDVWLSKFLFPSVEKTFESLKPNGRMIVNISDVYSGNQINKICDAMNDRLEEVGAREGKHFVYRMAKRVGSKANGSVFGEPCWVWKKR